jgi:hypothetical protein
VKAFSKTKRENTLEGSKTQESIGCGIGLTPGVVRTDS